MPKRKFCEFRDQSPPSSTTSNPPSNYDRLSTLLAQHKAALLRALKLARGFERQKLGRRQKTALANKELDDIRRLKLEIGELKALDLANIAETHLYKSLLRVKAIATSGGLPGYVRDVLVKGKSGERMEKMNVMARLFKAEPVREAMGVAVDGVRDVLGIRGEGKRRLRARDYENGQISGRREGLGRGRAADSDQKEEQKEEIKMEEKDEEWGGLSPSPARDEQALRFEVEDDDFESVDGDNYEYYAARLAASSGSDSDSDSDTNLDPDSNNNHHHLSTQPSPLSESRSPSLTTRTQPPHLQHHPSMPFSSRPPLSTTKTKTTTLLPTLQTSAYYSGSSLSCSRSPSPTSKPYPNLQRKNRMGQQARRALWEKKFKSGARHLREEVARETVWGQGNDRGKYGSIGTGQAGRDRGAKAGDWKSSRRPAGRTRVSIGNDHAAGASATSASRPKGDEAGDGNGPLHPSWEAARRAKAKAKTVGIEIGIGINGVKGVGRKVVF